MSEDVFERAARLPEMVVAVDGDGVSHQLSTVGEAARFLTDASHYVQDSLEYNDARKSLKKGAADTFCVHYAVKTFVHS